MEPIPAFLVVRQTFTGIWARLLTERSASETISAELVPAADGVMNLAAVYRNTPRMSERMVSPIHFGSFLVELDHDPANSLAGHYWTDRKTGGEMDFAARSKKLATGFEQAAKLNFTRQKSDGARQHGRRPARRKASAMKRAAREDFSDGAPAPPGHVT